jgi:major membrane immunogen (membrane-anchored lipoprotein)
LAIEIEIKDGKMVEVNTNTLDFTLESGQVVRVEYPDDIDLSDIEDVEGFKRRVEHLSKYL